MVLGAKCYRDSMQSHYGTSVRTSLLTVNIISVQWLYGTQDFSVVHGLVGERPADQAAIV